MPNIPHVFFYTKPGCCLCDEAKREIQMAGCEDEYTFEEINIESDPELKARFGWDIPVVYIDGVVCFKHRLTADQFRRAVQAARLSQS